MKLNLLLATSLITGAAFGQFNQTNEPAIGASTNLYVVDSNAANLSAITGTGVTWDYSAIGGYGASATKTISVVTPASTPSGANFASSAKAIQIPNFITTYFTSTGTERVSQGFSFEDASAGTVDVVLSGNPELLMNYPFAVPNTLTDAFAGNAYTGLIPGTPIPTTGNITASVDGSGTLKLSNTITLNNVLRYKIVENATANAGLLTVQINRTQFEYYDLANSTLPVFVHTQLTIDMGSPMTQNLVMSSVLPTSTAGLNDLNAKEFGLYPNPANESVTLSGLSGNETISIVDLAGKTVLSTENTGATQTINVSDIKAGIYNVVVISNGSKSTKKLTIN
ncbi:hypothetical protein D3C71_605240 [compost metagenome]